MSKDAPLGNVALFVILTLISCAAWTLLTGQCWFWIPVIAAFAVVGWIMGKAR